MSKRTILLFMFSLVILMITSHSIFAAQQSSSPSQELFEGVKSAFAWVIGISAGLAGVVFVYGAIEYMLFANADGKDRMLWSVVGLIVSLVSLLIIQRINPALVNPLNLAALPETGNVFLVKANGDRTPANTNFRKKAVMDAGYIGLVYDCGKLNPNTTPRLLVSTYTDFLHLPNHSQTKQITCSNQVVQFASVSSDVWVILWEFEFPGVYFYTDPECKGIEPNILTGKSNIGPEYIGPKKEHIKNFPASFVNKVKCMIFVKGYGVDQNFVVFPTETPNIVNDTDGSLQPSQPCGVYYSDIEAEKTPIPLKYCKNSVKSALIFYIPDDPKVAGNEIIFYSAPYGWDTKYQQTIGQFKLTFEDIDQENGINKDPSTMTFQYAYPNTDLTTENGAYQKKCKTFKDCPGSIRVSGDYLVSLQSRSKDKKLLWDKSSTRDINNLSVEQAFRPEYPDFFSVFILPIIK